MMKLLTQSRAVLAMILLVVVSSRADLAFAQTTQPAGQSTPNASSPAEVDRLLNQMLQNRAGAGVIQPRTFPTTPMTDNTSGLAAVAPNAPTMPLLREGTFLVDRSGRLGRSPDGAMEFRFDSDGRALRDPPMIVLSNSKLMQMEEENKRSNRDLRFRITGIITEYRGRNGVLIEKVVVIPDVVQQNN